MDFIFPIIKLTLIMAIMALGVHITFRILDTADLSIEGVFPLGASITALLLSKSLNPILVIIIAVICGLIAGFITGILHTKLKIPMILSGIITMTAFYSINMVILGFANSTTITMATLRIENSNSVFYKIIELFKTFISDAFIASNVATIIVCAICIAIVYVAIYYFFGTKLGMAIRATGDNEVMAKAQGINTDKMKVIGIMISNALIALAGSLFAQNSGSANVQSGRGMIVVALAAIIVGEAIFGRRSYKLQLISIIIGTLIYYLLRQVAIKTNLTNFLDLVSAILITILLVLPIIKQNIIRKKGNKYVRN